MMAMKKWLIISACVLLASACGKKDDLFQRDTDAVTASGIAQSLRHYLLCSGHWTSESDADWITIVPESGDGNGVDFQPYDIKVRYNTTMAPRTGTFYLIHNGLRCPVTVTQDAVVFNYVSIRTQGFLIKDIASGMKICVAYTDASSEISVKFAATVRGDGSAGLQVSEQTIQMEDGDGEAVISVSGTPTTAGTVYFDVTAGGTPVGTVKTSVAADSNPHGLPCGWNFYAAGWTNATRTDLQQSAEGQSWINAPHALSPTSGVNPDALLTAEVAKGATDWSLNPGIQVQGMLQNDYWQAVIPVQNMHDGTKIKVEAGCGSAGKSVGYYLLEYSGDGAVWNVADGAVNCSRGTDVFPAHLWNTASSIVSPTRVTYDKDTDDTYRQYSFAVYGIDGDKLYLRLRALKYNATPGATTVVKSGWTDLKGLEISFDE